LNITILEAGLLDTIQDNGRYGYASSGINYGGSMDPFAAAVANCLVGNETDEAVLELHFPSSTIRFNSNALIAISGADFSACINDVSIPINTPIIIAASSILQFKKHRLGARAYLAVKGGLELDRWLGSFSTNLKVKAGGFNGRQLQQSDKINFKLEQEYVSFGALHFHADVGNIYEENIIRIIPGNEYNLITDCSETILTGNSFTITSQSDRMGYRMSGSPMKMQQPKEMISSAVTKGTIQLLPNGEIIILMSDHQTTGGYPRIAHVISADIPKLAQMPFNTQLRFQIVTLEEAEAAMYKQHRHLLQLQNACNFRIQEYFKQHALD